MNRDWISDFVGDIPENFVFRVVLVYKPSSTPLNIKIPSLSLLYVGELTRVPLLFPCKSVIVAPLPPYYAEIDVS